VEDVAALFEYDWNGGMGTLDLACTRLVVGPTNSRARITALIERATDTLRIQELSFSDDDIRAAVIARAGAGVDVEVILADPGWIDSNVEAAEVLRRGGATVRFLSALDNHAKLIVADDAAAYVGSTNISWTSLTRNREVGVVLTDAPAVADLIRAFDADFAAAR
jgi:phosphatidylserine/phosphatidylglycerophosphate/cardiolipin synthase-like enzyme